MSNEEFFQILANSNLIRAMSWYFSSEWLSKFGVMIAVFCVFVFLLHFLNRLRVNKQRSQGMFNAITEDNYLSLYILNLSSALIGLWGFTLVARIRSDPQRLIKLISESANDLYDLTPMGIQFIVDYLFLIAIFSFINLSILVLTAVILTKIVERENKKKKKEETKENITLLLSDNNPRFINFMPIVRYCISISFAGFVIFVIWNISAQIALISVNNLRSENLLSCSPGYGLNLIWTEWLVSDSNIPYAKSRLIIRDTTIQNDNQRRSLGCVNVQTSTMKPHCVPVFNYIEFDPIDIYIIPIIPHKNTQTEDAFLSMSLLELFDGCPENSECKEIADFDNSSTKGPINGFNLFGNSNGDRIYIYDTSSNIIEGTSYLWPENAVRDIYWTLQEDRHEVSSLPTVDQIMTWMTNIGNREITVSQVEPKKLLLFVNWRNNSQINASYLSKFKNDNINIWLLDFLPQDINGIDDLTDKLRDKEIDHIVIQIPSDGLISNLRYNLSSVRNGLKNQNIVGKLKNLRSTYVLNLAEILGDEQSGKVWAALDSGEIRLSKQSDLGEASSCINDFSLDNAAVMNPYDDESAVKDIELIYIGLSRLIFQFGLPLLNLIFPVSILSVAVGLILVWSKKYS